jgi:hypothetical protein
MLPSVPETRNPELVFGLVGALGAQLTLAAKELRTITGDSTKPESRTAYILRSMKTPEEVSSLRSAYGQSTASEASRSVKTFEMPFGRLMLQAKGISTTGGN